MKYWIWICLELLIVFGTGAWIYFLSEDALAKGLVGFGILCLVEECKEINRRKIMDYKEGMTCGECLQYAFCPVANHNIYHKACMKITTKENYTIEQNAGENQVEGGVVSISGFIDIPDDIKRECRTCKNPYCSRTIDERQKVEVQVHTQYGWECCDKENYLQNDGGLVLVKKEEFEKAEEMDLYFNKMQKKLVAWRGKDVQV